MATIPGVSDGELIRTTWGDAVADELNIQHRQEDRRPDDDRHSHCSRSRHRQADRSAAPVTTATPTR